MKTINHYFKNQGLLHTALFLVLIFVASCTKEYMAPEEYTKDWNNMEFKSLEINEGTVNLDGFTRFSFYVNKENRFITDGYTENFLACTAELIFGEKKDFILNTKESFILPDGNQMLIREISFNGKITNGGSIEFTWPETWIEMGEVQTDVLGIMSEHTGYDLRGRGVNKDIMIFKGLFDGEKFFAEMHLTGFQEKPGTLPFFFDIVDGPVKVKVMFDLKLSN